MKSLIPMGCILQHLKNFTHVYHFETSKPLNFKNVHKENQRQKQEQM